MQRLDWSQGSIKSLYHWWKVRICLVSALQESRQQATRVSAQEERSSPAGPQTPLKLPGDGASLAKACQDSIVPDLPCLHLACIKGIGLLAYGCWGASVYRR